MYMQQHPSIAPLQLHDVQRALKARRTQDRYESLFVCVMAQAAQAEELQRFSAHCSLTLAEQFHLFPSCACAADYAVLCDKLCSNCRQWLKCLQVWLFYQ
jgi:hypothetical protein